MDKDFFASNRAALLSKLGGGLVVLTAFSRMQGAADSAAAFTQEANFFWLTGVTSPDWWLIIDNERSWLVSPEVSETNRLFDGSLAPAAAVRQSGVDEVITRAEATELLQRLARRHKSVYTPGRPRYAKDADFTLNPAPKKLRRLLKQTFSSIEDCQKELSRLRAIKQPVELARMAEAAELSVAAFEAAKAALPSSHDEYEVEAELGYYFRRHGATHAFEPIVAAGMNACTLHYTDNSSELQPGQLVLIDAGAQLSGYPADITRTYAAGEPTERQSAVHAAVQSAERRIGELLKPGLGLRDYVESVDMIMKEALLALGLIESRRDDAKYRRYFPHAISHGLGLEVHESLGGFKELVPGMVLTVEPGIYIPEEAIGVRIENDFVVTDKGCHNVTGSLSTDL